MATTFCTIINYSISVIRGNELFEKQKSSSVKQLFQGDSIRDLGQSTVRED